MTLPAAIRREPSLDRWLRLEADGRVRIYTGKVEIGQGIRTALAMIAAEELEVELDRIVVQTADTERTPNELVTAGSMSVEDSGSAIRVAGATAREVLMALAAEALEVEVEDLEVRDGMITAASSNEQTDYWTLLEGGGFGVEILAVPPLRAPESYRVVGRRATRLDLPAKVAGEAAFVHDLVLPHMQHGRLVKPPHPEARLVQCPESLGAAVTVVRDGSFLGVVADREELAVSAAEQLAARCEWTTPEPAPGDMVSYLRDNVSHSLAVVDGTPVTGAVVTPPVPGSAAQTLSASFTRPYQMHASLGPSAAVAQFANGRLTVFCHSQGVELLKPALADALQLPLEEVHVIHVEGAGCYGHNGADDVALDAALLALAVQPNPVRLSWTRTDEHGYEPYAPAAVIDMQASLDANGSIVDWRHEAISFSHIGRPRPYPGHTNLQSAWWRGRPIPPAPREPAMFPEVGIHRNLEPIYRLPTRHLVKHLVAESPWRTSSVRSLGAFANVFAIESFMDELAHAAAADVFEFRLRHLDDPRARSVLERLAQACTERPAAPGTGRGIALARYKNRQTWCAMAVDVEVADDATIRLDHTMIVADAGLVIDPDGLINQLTGGFIQAASWTLKEAVTWDAQGITSRNWDSYPILRFSEIPEIDVQLVHRHGERALGAGEASTGPTPAAIANAVFDATGVRARDLPLDQAALRAAAAH